VRARALSKEGCARQELSTNPILVMLLFVHPTSNCVKIDAKKGGGRFFMFFIMPTLET